MLALLLLALAAAPPAVDPPKPKPAPLSPAECAALAEHGFALYLANLKHDEGIQYELKDVRPEEQATRLAEIARLLKEDKPRYVSEAQAQCLERSRTGQGTRKQYDCAMAATTFPRVEKCLGLKLSGQAL